MTDAGKAVTVADVMRPAVTSIERYAHIAAAAYLMKQANDTALVVLDDAERRVPIAVITDTDVAQAVADGKDVNNVRISGAMTVIPPSSTRPPASRRWPSS